MAWPALADKVKTLPLVLAGPMLRRVTSKAVTVWLALSQHAKVTLTVYGPKIGQAGDVVLAQGDRETVAIGAHVHLVAVTARADMLFSPGFTYSYDLSFAGDFGTRSLNDAVAGFQLAYPPLKLPSFVMPPYTVNKLRLIHGSCRKPHGGADKGESHDALPLLDDLLATAVMANAPLDRPHQLLLTGDQIYADDVADSLLILLIDAANALLPGWDAGAALGGAGYQASVGLRHDLVVASGFTSDDTRSHLLSLSEWLMMYLFAWSDVLWSELPTLDDAIANLPYAVPSPDDGEFGGGTVGSFQHVFDSDDDKDKYTNERKRVDDFRGTVGKVRRALANIPTFMICDDHEVTDDWNMTYNFCKGVYSTVSGREIVTNGLVAYTLCQAWGNTPEQFEDGDEGKPAGLQLLELLDKGDQAAYYKNEDTLATLVGVHDHDTMAKQAEYGVFHDSAGYTVSVEGLLVPKGSLYYHYTIEGFAHQIIVTDTRTWRAQPRGGDEPPDLLTDLAMQEQLRLAPKLDGRQAMVVVTTNMPPIASFRAAARHPIVGVYGHDLYESWDLPSLQFDRMVLELVKRQPKDKNGAYTGSIIVLSGDVHSSFASRLEYRASAPVNATVVFAQLVSSALKNESDDTRGQHDDGYTYHPDYWYQWPFYKGTVEQIEMPPFVPEGFLGWNLQSTQQVAATGLDEIDVDPSKRWTVAMEEFEPDVLTHYDVTRTPDWYYRLDYLTTVAGGQYPGAPPTLPVMGPSLSGTAALGAYAAAAGAYLKYAKTRGGGREIVGHNNLAEVTFSDDLVHVHHTVRWQENGNVSWGRYDVVLKLDAAAYPKLTVSGL